MRCSMTPVLRRLNRSRTKRLDFPRGCAIRQGGRATAAPIIDQQGRALSGIAADRSDRSAATRWAQLLFGVACMVMIANLQYGWTLFVGPMHRARGWATADIQIAFSIFIALETWLTP